jgi:hypothetical protein
MVLFSIIDRRVKIQKVGVMSVVLQQVILFAKFNKQKAARNANGFSNQNINKTN